MNVLKPISFIMLLLCISCSKNQTKHLGQSKADLVAEKGEPDFKGVTENKTEYFSYTKNTAFEIDQKGTVITEFREPLGKEKSLRYWMELWKPLSNVSESKVLGSHDHDPQLQYLSKDTNTAVIFSVSQQEVQRVIRYHKSQNGTSDK